MTTQNEWPLWEVFVRAKAGLDHKHCGSLHAADSKMAIQLARDVYTRRQEGTSVWVVRSDQIVASVSRSRDSATATSAALLRVADPAAALRADCAALLAFSPVAAADCAASLAFRVHDPMTPNAPTTITPNVEMIAIRICSVITYPYTRS